MSSMSTFTGSYMTQSENALLHSLPLSDFSEHRSALFAKLANNSIALFPAASEITRSNDTEYGFCQNKNFYYLTGFNEPDALLVLIKDNCAQTQSILFSLPKDPQHEVWHGRRIGQIKAVNEYKFDQCFELASIDDMLPDYLNGKSQVYFGFDNKNLNEQSFTAKLFTWINAVKCLSRQGCKPPENLTDVNPILAELRLIKTANEIALMRQANVISGIAHQRAMKHSKVGLYEYQIEAEILHEFSYHNARYAAYGTIVAGGDNANILHYTDNSDTLKDNELLLIDAGGELGGYAADITRTFPVNGKFTPEQKSIYQLVLDAKNLAIKAIKPGVCFAQLNQITNAFLTEGLLSLGILSGELEQLISDKKVNDYFIHGLGHWLGLDVHDVGDYHSNTKREQCRPFEVGMAMTIEPGIYLPQSDLNLDKKWRGIGVRIEDNIVVTEHGCENLTVTVPDTIEAIESLMKKS